MKNNNFNAAQLEAVQHTTGPAMVLAGPGSGKTTVIAWRLKYLIEEYGADPASILVITFTRMAAIEMQYRFMKITDSSYPEVSFGTFHSIFYQIIRSSPLYKNSNLSIVNDGFKSEIIKDILSLLNAEGAINRDEYDDALSCMSDIISGISKIKNSGENPESFSSIPCIRRTFPRIFTLYNKRLKEFGRIDFDDMIIECHRILSSDPVLLEFWKKKYRFILIDEYQDINMMQYKVVRLLSAESENIFAVGDDDQSIYGFRGSDPGIMLDFSESFKDRETKLISLNINYRCAKDILRNSLLVINENKMRYKKDLCAFEENPKGAVIARRYESRQIQNEQIAAFLKRHEDALSEIAILLRTNSEAAALSKVLSDHGIPNNLEGEKDRVYDDEAVKLCLDYLSFAYEGNKRSDFLKIMNHPLRYISRDAAAKEIIKENDLMRFYKGNTERQREVKKLFGHIRMINHLRPPLAVRYLRKSLGLDGQYPGSKRALDEFEKDASYCEDTMKFLKDIRARSESEKEKQKALKKKSSRGNVVNLLTMHASKGLEFEIVWLPDLNEGIIPSRSAVLEKETEEERRMLYVAMTRAKRALIMSYITGNKENPMLPCRFLRPIKQLWDEKYEKKGDNSQTSSEPSSGRSTISSNSTSSR